MKKVSLAFLIILFHWSCFAQNITISSDITDNTSWKSSEVDTVFITHDIKLTSGDTLDIIGGVAVIFSPLTTFNVEGALIATGSEGDTIRFGVIDTSGFMDFRYNAYGGWGGIICTNGKIQFDYCELSHVKYANPEDTTAWGYLNYSSAYRFGGAIYGSNADLSLTNSVIRNCFAKGGSALTSNNSSRVVISDCLFENNVSWHTGTVTLMRSGSYRTNISRCDFFNNKSLGGSGLYLFMGDSLFVDDCRFYNNIALREDAFQSIISGGTNGAAIYLSGNSFSNKLDVNITNCEMMYGQAGNHGGAIYSIGNVKAVITDNIMSHNKGGQNTGGAISINTDANYNTTDIHIARNIITNNQATFGGGINYSNFASPVHTLNIINNLIANNFSSYDTHGLYGGGGGGGIRTNAWNDSINILNNTIVNNFSNFMSGGVYIQSPSNNTTLTGNLIWGNQSSDTPYKSEQIGFFGDTATADLPTIKYNLIQNGIDSIAIIDYLTYKYYIDDSYTGVNENNITLEPLMIAPTLTTSYTDDALQADFRISGYSNALNAGDPLINVSQKYMGTDLAGNLRIYEGLYPFIDIGCYEFQGESTVSTPDIAFDLGLIVFPNPATDRINIIPSGKLQGETSVSIFGINGLLLKHNKFQSHESIEVCVGDLSKGIYLIKINSIMGVETKMFVVQ